MELSQEEIKEVKDLLQSLRKIDPVPKKITRGIRTYQRIPTEKALQSFRVLAAFICQKHNITWWDLISKNRKQEFVRARVDFSHVAFNKIIENKEMIGRFLGRNGVSPHSSISHLLYKTPSYITDQIEGLFEKKDDA